MKIWFRDFSVDEINARGRNSMVEHLDIQILEIGENFIRGSMPVDERTKQPHGLLHGGASVVLAETLASTAGNMVINPSTQYCVGLEINANHIRSATGGRVESRTTPLHIGRSTQVWQSEITQNGKLICVSRMTLAVKDRDESSLKVPRKL